MDDLLYSVLIYRHVSQQIKGTLTDHMLSLYISCTLTCIVDRACYDIVICITICHDGHKSHHDITPNLRTNNVLVVYLTENYLYQIQI